MQPYWVRFLRWAGTWLVYSFDGDRPEYEEDHL